MPDQAAIRRLKNGEITGLEALIARYQLKAVRAAYFILQSQPAAEDVVQETFIHLFKHIRKFDENRPFEPYFMRSVVNRALNLARKHAREISLDGIEDSQHLESLLIHAASVESQAEITELQRIILETIARLPPRQRAAIVQRYYLDMSEEEMALALEAPPGTVKWLLHAARTRLRSLLGPQGREAR
ncbi:MAG: sigma-70 family RNA polymerase sigma factor [Chloroflexi bacterium]|nr:sigma-70 family RNA polymerase sigma factor [Chloroflexota bacterium]